MYSLQPGTHGNLTSTSRSMGAVRPNTPPGCNRNTTRARPRWGQDTPPSCIYPTEDYCPAAGNSVVRENTPLLPGSNGQSLPLTGRNAPNQARGHWPQKNNIKAVSIIVAHCDWYRRPLCMSQHQNEWNTTNSTLAMPLVAKAARDPQ
jgi:hypothetical protein